MERIIEISRSHSAEAHRQEVEHFDQHWRQVWKEGKLDLVIPPDEEIWRRDLGRARRIAFEWLGDLRGKRVLELGCGPGDNTILMARRGANVIALDIAPSSLDITRRCASANRLERSVHLSRMMAESLAFRNGSFDWVVGFGFLHHVDSSTIGDELRRVLRPDGRALFFEPLGTNPLLEFSREHLPYRGKHHSPNEHPLTYDDLRHMGKSFKHARAREFYLFSMISRVVASERAFGALWALDEFLIKHLRAVRRWCRYVLVEYEL